VREIVRKNTPAGNGALWPGSRRKPRFPANAAGAGALAGYLQTQARSRKMTKPQSRPEEGKSYETADNRGQKQQQDQQQKNRHKDKPEGESAEDRDGCC